MAVRSVQILGGTIDHQTPLSESGMSKLLRGIAAGYGAKRLGGGCFSTVIIFIILWYILGHFGIFK